jgi:hypothetical protein
MTDDMREVAVTDSLKWVHSDNVDGITFVFHVDSTKDHQEWIFHHLCELSFLIFHKENDE